MQIDEFLRKYKIKVKDASRQLDIPLDAIYRYRRGGKVEIGERAKRIEEWSKGEIKADEIRR